MKTKKETKTFKVYGVVDIVDENGNCIKSYDEETHGKKYKKLAEQFVEKETGKWLQAQADNRGISTGEKTQQELTDAITAYDKEDRNLPDTFHVKELKLVPTKKKVEVKEK